MLMKFQFCTPSHLQSFTLTGIHQVKFTCTAKQHHPSSSVPSPTDLASKNVSVNIVDLTVNSPVHVFNKFMRIGHLRFLGIDQGIILKRVLKNNGL